MNGGTCREAGPFDKFRCECPPGFTGFHCEVDLCRGFCVNHGECSIHPVVGPKCKCVDGYTGDRCEYDSQCPHCNDKLPSCAIICENGGICEKVNNQELCRCVGDWRGKLCDTPPDCVDDCGRCNESSSINECR
jgi:hypothetical protein